MCAHSLGRARCEELYDLLMDIGFNSGAQKLRGNKAATVIAVKNLGRCFALVALPPFVHPIVIAP